MAGRTTLVIAHGLTTVTAADCIVVTNCNVARGVAKMRL